MTKRKIRTGLGIIVFMIYALTAAAFVWNYKMFEKNQEVIDQPQKMIGIEKPIAAQPQKQSALSDQNVSASEISHIPDFGAPPKKSTVLIYETIQRLGSQCNTKNDMVVINNYYIRDINGTFNKQIFSGKNFGYSFTPTDDGKGFNAIFAPYNEVPKNYLIDFSGNIKEVRTENENNNSIPDGKRYVREIPSPNGRYIARSILYDKSAEMPTIVEIYDTKTKKTDTYDFKSDSFNGTFIDSWSPDSKSLYAVGGIYEFSAPAKLWRIDVGSKEPYPYKQIEGMKYPVIISPENNIAFIRDKDHFNEQSNGDLTTNIYSVDLANGTIKKVTTENGFVSFPSIFYGNNIYYHVSQNSDDISQSSDIKILDAKKNKVDSFIKDAAITYPSFAFKKSETFAYTQGGNTYISTFNNPNNKTLLGKNQPRSCTDTTPGTEYILNVLASSK